MVPEEWLRRFAGIVSAGEESGDHVRFKIAQAALLDALLAAQPAVSLDERFLLAREELATLGGGLTPLDPARSFVGQLRDYQRDGLGWLAFLREFGFGGCLADDMGLGKTVKVLAWLERLRASREANGAVAGRRARARWSSTGSTRPRGSRRAARARLHRRRPRASSASKSSPTTIVLTTYGTLRRDVAALQGRRVRLRDPRRGAGDQERRHGRRPRPRGCCARKHRLALSGTPVENHLGELWSLFEFLNPGMLGTAAAFERHGVAAARGDPRGARVLLARALRPFILRRTKEQVAPELPEKTEQTIYCELERHAAQAVRRAARPLPRGAARTHRSATGMQKSKIQVLEALLRLRQAACHPGLIDKRRSDEPSRQARRAAAAADRGASTKGTRRWSSRSSPACWRIVRAAPRRARTSSTNTSTARRATAQQPVERFQNDPDCRVFLISLKAGGLGLNLTAADYVFLLDPWWNPAVEAQAIDRAHRIGQTRHVFAYRLIAADTVEEKILELQQTKRDLADAIVSADVGLLRNLKAEDLEILLS